jgi:two-component system, LytTR family, response regulator
MNRGGAHLTQQLLAQKPLAQKLRVMLVDDEGLARNFLRRMLAKDDDIQEIQECSSATEARERIQQCCPDILFLDVKMPGLSGFDLLEKLSEEDQPVVVFTTAFANYAPRAFDIQACDYVMKPFDEDRLFLALDRAKEALRNQLRRARSPFRITVADRGRNIRLCADDILWMAAEDNYVRIRCGRETLLVRSTLNKLERDFKRDVLLRVHRSWIVNVNSVKEIRQTRNYQYTLVLADGTAILSSRRYKRSLRTAFQI